MFAALASLRSLLDEEDAAINDDPNGGGTFHSDTASIGTLKFVLTCSILAMGFLSVFAPRHLTGTPSIFSLGNMMASGVLLAAGLVHQLASSARILNQPDQFPWAMFIAGLTFLLFMVLEESLHLALGADHAHDAADVDSISATAKAGGAGNDDSNGKPLNLHAMMHAGCGGTSSNRGEENLAHSHSHQHTQQHHRNHNHNHAHSSTHSEGESEERLYLPTGPKHASDPHNMEENQASSEVEPFFHSALATYNNSSSITNATTAVGCGPDNGGSFARLSMCCATGVSEDQRPKQGLSGQPLGPANSRRTSQFGSFLQSNKSHNEDRFMLTEHHHHDDHIALHLHGSIVASGILMVALSIHSILAGISIGIETRARSITGTAVAILAHKSFEGFCLGSSLVNAQLDHFPFLILGVSFSCATPLGIILGQLFINVWTSDDPNDHNNGSGDSINIAIVQAIVAGTFLYIAIVEIAAKELLVCRHDVVGTIGQRIEIAKLACFVGGYVAMSALAIVL